MPSFSQQSLGPLPFLDTKYRIQFIQSILAKQSRASTRIDCFRRAVTAQTEMTLAVEIPRCRHVQSGRLRVLDECRDIFRIHIQHHAPQEPRILFVELSNEIREGHPSWKMNKFVQIDQECPPDRPQTGRTELAAKEIRSGDPWLLRERKEGAPPDGCIFGCFPLRRCRAGA